MDVKFVQLLMQYLEMQRRIEPLLGAASQKLVKDLMDTGVPLRKISKITGRSPGYVLTVYRGHRALSARALCDLFRYAARAQNAE